MNCISPSVQNPWTVLVKHHDFFNKLVMEKEVVDSTFFWPILAYLWSHSAANYANICFL